jgi:hypothetical protein
VRVLEVVLSEEFRKSKKPSGLASALGFDFLGFLPLVEI